MAYYGFEMTFGSGCAALDQGCLLLIIYTIFHICSISLHYFTSSSTVCVYVTGRNYGIVIIIINITSACV